MAGRVLANWHVNDSDGSDGNRSSVWSAASPRRFAFLKRKAARADTAGKLSEVIFRPGGATEISRWWSEAQPPGQVEEDCSRPGRDAGPEFATGPIPVRRPFRARGPVVAFPAPTLRSATG